MFEFLERNYLKLIGLSLPVLMGIVLAAGSLYVIDEGERGIVVRLGEVQNEVGSGMHFKAPFVDEVKRVSMRTYTHKFENIPSYSADAQPVKLSISLTLKAVSGESKELYVQFKTLERFNNQILAPYLNDTTKKVFGQYDAVSAIKNREKMANEIKNSFANKISKYSFVKLQTLQLENIDFSNAFEQMVEDRMKAEVEVEKYQQTAERERIQANIAETKADGEMRSRIKRAEGEAQSIKLKAKAEAEAIALKGEALQRYPKLIELMRLEKWNGVTPTTVLSGETGSPIISIK